MNAHFDEFGMADDLRSLSQAYRNAVKHEDDQEPPRALDEAILAAAHRAVASRPQAVPARQPQRLARWRVPLALAASFLAGVLIADLFVLETEKTGPEVQILAQAPQMSRMPQPPALPELLAEPSPPPPPSQKPLPAQADEATARQFSAAADRKEQKDTSEFSVQPKVVRGLTEPAQAEDFDKKASDARIAKPVPLFEAHTGRPAIAKADASPAAPMMDAADNEPAVPAAEVLPHEYPGEIRELAAAPAVAKPADTPIHGRSKRFSEPPDAIAGGQAAEVFQPTEERAPTPESAPVMLVKSMPADMERAKNASDMSATAETATEKQSPQVWLKKIEKLRRNGKIKEARESLAEFRKHYPNHELPKALHGL